MADVIFKSNGTRTRITAASDKGRKWLMDNMDWDQVHVDIFVEVAIEHTQEVSDELIREGLDVISN